MLKLSCFDLFFLRNARDQIPNCIVHITNHNPLLSFVLSTFKKYRTEINEDTKKKIMLILPLSNMLYTRYFVKHLLFNGCHSG